MFAEGDSAASVASAGDFVGSAEGAVSGAGFLGSGVGLVARAAGASGAGFCVGGALVNGAGGAFASSERQCQLVLLCAERHMTKATGTTVTCVTYHWTRQPCRPPVVVLRDQPSSLNLEGSAT